MCGLVQMDFPQLHNLGYLNYKHNVTTMSVIIFHNQRHYIAIPTSLTYQVITVDVSIPLR